jgi:hypothetical protein
MRRRDVISREVRVAGSWADLCASQVRDLQAFREAAQQGSVVTRMGPRAAEAAADVERRFEELLLKMEGTDE